MPTTQVGGSLMIRILLYCISLTGLLVIGSQLTAQPIHTQSDSGKQSKPATKSITGKIISIGDTGDSFAVEVDVRSTQTMEFVLNNKTQVQDTMKIGTL